MSVEVVTAWVGKLIWTPAFGYIWWRHKKDTEKLENTYTKQEIEKILALELEKQDEAIKRGDENSLNKIEVLEKSTSEKIVSLEKSTEQRFDSTDSKFDMIVALIKDSAEDYRKSMEKQAESYAKIEDKLNDIQTKLQ